uniref:Uncharacterized protein n=1 Tax=Populus trichocarpa TaxID=3694 RepID=A9PCM8_POPTR|nr:unknown [Populus trichocarpa]
MLLFHGFQCTVKLSWRFTYTCGTLKLRELATCMIPSSDHMLRSMRMK